MDDPTTVYRLYNHADTLLYIGIARNWPSRMTQHASDKPWWPDVRRVTTELHPTRKKALDVERDAIVTERPQHNVVHNGTKKPRIEREESAKPSYKPSYGMPLRRGQVVALGHRNGDCPVGLIESADEEWVSITKYSWLTERFTLPTVALRIEDCERIQWADWHVADDGISEFQMDRLANFQTAWDRSHQTPMVPS